MTIKELRKQKNWPISELAEKVGVSTAYISHLETGKRKLSPEMAQRIAKALAVSPNTFVEAVKRAQTEVALDASWISHIKINGYPVFDSFTFHINSNPSKHSRSSMTPARVKAEFIQYITDNLRYSLTAELETNTQITRVLAERINKASN
jgi:transcriptional regulator with XRE-family HTH domain